jgi:hypothetical protein
LTNLPFGTSARDLQDITLATKAKAVYIPRSNNYKPRPFAIFYFETADMLNDAIKIPYAFGDNELQWCSAESKCCHKCGSPDHIVVKCPQINVPNDDTPPNDKKPRNLLPSVQKLYNRFKPAGSRALIINNPNSKKNDRQPNLDPNMTYSNATSNNNKGKGRAIGPDQSVKDSIHNPVNNNDTNKKLDQILNMLSGMQQAMNDLEVRISKLEKSQQNIPIIPVIPPPVIPVPIVQQSSSNSNKRTRASTSSSDENSLAGPKHINLQMQATIDEQNSIIATQKLQMQKMMTELQSLTQTLSQ